MRTAHSNPRGALILLVDDNQDGILARQSDLPPRKVTIVDRHRTYAHNDPSAAAPRNAFLKHLVPFLEGIGHR